MTDTSKRPRYPSRVLAFVWLPTGLVLLFLLAVCSAKPIQSFGVVAAWVSLQFGANYCAPKYLDKVWPDPNAVDAMFRGLITALTVAVVSWPVMLLLLPDQLRDCL